MSTDSPAMDDLGGLTGADPHPGVEGVCGVCGL